MLGESRCCEEFEPGNQLTLVISVPIWLLSVVTVFIKIPQDGVPCVSNNNILALVTGYCQPLPEKQTLIVYS